MTTKEEEDKQKKLEKYPWPVQESLLKQNVKFKILVIGSRSAGKSSFIRQYVLENFDNKYSVTVGAEILTKVIQWENYVIRVQLWDLSGEERTLSMTTPFFRDANGVFVVYDCSDKDGIASAAHWKRILDNAIGDDSNIPCILLANKSDLCQAFERATVDKFSTHHGFLTWFQTSAKTKENINMAVQFMLSELMKNMKSEISKQGSIKLEQNLERSAGLKKSFCSC